MTKSSGRPTKKTKAAEWSVAAVAYASVLEVTSAAVLIDHVCYLNQNGAVIEWANTITEQTQDYTNDNPTGQGP